jgi:hypothetical protein
MAETQFMAASSSAAKADNARKQEVPKVAFQSMQTVFFIGTRL